KPFFTKVGKIEKNAGDVSAGLRGSVCKSAANGIGLQVNRHDRNRGGRISSGLQCSAADCKNKVHLAGDQIGSHRGKQRRGAIRNLRNQPDVRWFTKTTGAKTS